MLKRLGYILICCVSQISYSQLIQAKRFYDVDSTKILEIFHFDATDSTLEGSYESFHLNGSLQAYGWYKNDLPDSLWLYYYENGRKKAEGTYRRGIPTNIWKYYFENGNIKSSGRLEGKEKMGKWTFYFENGGEKSEGAYEDEMKVGIWNYFYEDGSIKAQVAYEKNVGNYKEFYPFGGVKSEGQIIAEKSEGEWLFYYESGELEAIGNFRDGLRVGSWKYYHKNGNEKAVGMYQRGMKNGEWKYYHENGKLSQSGQINQDQKEGYWKLFYPSGETQGEVTYNEGSGTYSEYYLSGRKKSEGQVIDEKKEGKWRYYAESGSVEGEANFDGGIGNYKGFYPDGTLKMTGTINDDKRVGKWTLYNPNGTTAGTYTPIYEDEKPIFKTRRSSDISLSADESFDKPNYRFKKRGIRYFNGRINEYRGLILGTNPLWLADNQLPIALEYYMQERLGYELQVNIIRDPFAVPNSEIPDYQTFSRGYRLQFRQKFYHEHRKLGMFYFGHELSYTRINYQVNHPDTLIFPTFPKTGNMIESGFGYGLFIGNRWMRDVGDSGLSIDTFLGIGIANRSYKREFEPDPVLDVYFDQIEESSVYFPIIFGINIGFAGPGNKSKTQ